MSKTHVIDGKKYIEAERKAAVGEKVIIVNPTASNNKYANGDVLLAERVDKYGIFNKKAAGSSPDCHNPSGYICDEEYHVLEPLYTCDKCKTALGNLACSNSKGGAYCSVKCADADEPKVEETPSPELVDLIANLSAEVTQLKRSHAEQIDTLFRNVQQLGEELATMQTAEPVDNTPVTLPKWVIDRLMGGYRG